MQRSVPIINHTNPTPADALDEVRSGRYHLVVLDLMMPRMAGAETFRELKKLNPQVAVLLSTGHAVEYETQALMKQGAAGLLEKPYEFEEMVAALAKVFGG